MNNNFSFNELLPKGWQWVGFGSNYTYYDFVQDNSRTFFSVHLHSESDYAYCKFVPTQTLGPPTKLDVESDYNQTLSL